MVKSSIFKKVISGVLVLSTVCAFSMVSCFAKNDGPDEVEDNMRLVGRCDKNVTEDGFRVTNVIKGDNGWCSFGVRGDLLKAIRAFSEDEYQVVRLYSSEDEDLSESESSSDYYLYE